MPLIAKTPEQHLTDAKAMKLTGIEVIGPAKQFNGQGWFVNIRCLNCGKQKWIRKTLLAKTTSCGCLAKRNRKEKEMKEFHPPVEEKVQLSAEQKEVIDAVFELASEQKKVSVSRRLALAMASQAQTMWSDCKFWELPPALFNSLIADTQELYNALKEQE